MKICQFRISLLLLVLLFAGNVLADPYQGNFRAEHQGRTYQLAISRNALGRYQGVVVVGDEKLALDAQRLGDRIAGQIIGADGFSGFVAELLGNGLILTRQNGEVLRFRRE